MFENAPAGNQVHRHRHRRDAAQRHPRIHRDLRRGPAVPSGRVLLDDAVQQASLLLRERPRTILPRHQEPRPSPRRRRIPHPLRGNTQPDGAPRSNWPPARPDDFSIYIRAYWPQPAILDGTWNPPSRNPNPVTWPPDPRGDGQHQGDEARIVQPEMQPRGWMRSYCRERPETPPAAARVGFRDASAIL